MLVIGLGAEAVVDYALRFKREFGPGTWVCGYADDMIAYIPSRRVWEEGGYEGGSNLFEYGRPAFRWAGDVEDRIAASVQKLVRQVRRPASRAALAPKGRRGPEPADRRAAEEGVAPVPARVHLAGQEGKPVLAAGLPAFRDHFNCDGDGAARPASRPLHLHRRARARVSASLRGHSPSPPAKSASRRCARDG